MTAPSSRPRVEGERVEQIRARAELVVAAGGEGFASMATAINQSGSTPTLPFVSVLDVRDLAADWQHLTAEVERLRGRLEELEFEVCGPVPDDDPVRPIGEWLTSMIDDDHWPTAERHLNQLRASFAALALPTPAQEDAPRA